MGNTDSVPVVSQMKSLAQVISGDPAGALATQQNFAYNNTFPVISQIASAGYAIGGDNERALDLQKKFADDMLIVINSIPVAGHIKGGIHYAIGENEEGNEAMKAASRSTGVVIGGVGGFAAGGPVGAFAGGIAGGAALDGIITGSEILANGDEAKPYGYVAAGHEIAKAAEGQRGKITVAEGFDMALAPVSDGLAGLAAGKMIGKPLGLDVRGGKPIVTPARGAYRAPIVVLGEDGAGSMGKVKVVVSTMDDNPIPVNRGNVMALDNRANQLNPNHKPSGPGRPAGYHGDGSMGKVKVVVSTMDDNPIPVNRGNVMGLDKKALDNRANQLNPNHKPSGPGRPAGYHGDGTKMDLNNHANQLNPNHP